MEAADVLIMPFNLNELILSVNPVKLYEYVLSGKPCLAPKYGETEPFQDYVYLYYNKEDAINTITAILAGNLGTKKSKEDCTAFARQNTWEERGGVINNILTKLVKTMVG